MVVSLRQALVGRPSYLIERVMTSAKRADYDCESNANITHQIMKECTFYRRYTLLYSRKVAVRSTHGYMSCI